LPTLALTTVFPALLQVRAKDVALYRERLQLAYDALFWAAVVIAVVAGLTASVAIPFAFGQGFAESSSVLRWHVFGLPLYFTGSIAHTHLVAVNTAGRLLAMSTLGAAVNVVVNLLLIPPLGPIGAAIGTVSALAFSHCLGLLMFRDTRFLLAMFFGAGLPWSAAARWLRFLRS
jgi:O-antigen/teichoic acid export membrane protein